MHLGYVYAVGLETRVTYRRLKEKKEQISEITKEASNLPGVWKIQGEKKWLNHSSQQESNKLGHWEGIRFLICIFRYASSLCLGKNSCHRIWQRCTMKTGFKRGWLLSTYKAHPRSTKIYVLAACRIKTILTCYWSLHKKTIVVSYLGSCKIIYVFR